MNVSALDVSMAEWQVMPPGSQVLENSERRRLRSDDFEEFSVVVSSPTAENFKVRVGSTRFHGIHSK